MTDVTFIVRVSPITTDMQLFLDQLEQVLANTMGISVSQITAKLISKKRQSTLENEISVEVSPGTDPNSPSPADIVSNFIQNQTAIDGVRNQIPQVTDVTSKPLSSTLLVSFVHLWGNLHFYSRGQRTSCAQHYNNHTE